MNFSIKGLAIDRNHRDGVRAKYTKDGMVFIAIGFPTEESAVAKVLLDYISWKKSTPKPYSSPSS